MPRDINRHKRTDTGTPLLRGPWSHQIHRQQQGGGVGAGWGGMGLAFHGDRFQVCKITNVLGMVVGMVTWQCECT